ncbi:MAG: HAMP domain-containing histidine kinase, partial [Bacteroidia bacterium]|nr:HAMP domain-containing histidine kinase [Bacteroidia bacterium]
VLDSAVDGYYELIAKKSTIGFTFNNDLNSEFFRDDGVFDSIVGQIDLANENFGNLDSLQLKTINGLQVYRGSQADSLIDQSHNILNRSAGNRLKIESHDHKFKDSIELKDFQLLTSKVIISISSDSLKIKELDSLVGDKLRNKKLDLDYKLIYRSPDSSIHESKRDQYQSPLVTFSKSSFLPAGSALKMEFSNETRVLLRKSLVGILISTLLVLGVIGSLFYLLGIIRNQKQLAEVKNDLISNITHEFKTPIATIGVALEGFENFEAASDPAKAKSYLDISNQQLGKLNIMVEKLLETATLDSDTLILKKENVEMNSLVDSVVKRYQLSNPQKDIAFVSKTDSIFAEIDTFHFENAISNLIDNAVKYGGDSIKVVLDRSLDEGLELLVHDNGKGLSPTEKLKIFDKFYRVPKGNTHDVKGFGIGLYYAKTIIEKHGGTITVEVDNTGTGFIIKIP